MNDLKTRRRYPANYYFSVTPIPIQICSEISRLERDVWSAIYSRETIRYSNGFDGAPNLSNTQIADFVGSSRSRVSKAISNLVEVGLLERSGGGVPNSVERSRRRLSTIWPKWLIEKCDRFLKKQGISRSDEDEIDADESDEDLNNCSVGGSPVVTNGQPASDQRSTVLVTNGQPSSDQRSTLRSERKGEREEREKTATRSRRDGSDQRSLVATDLVEEIEEPLLDEGSVHASKLIEAERDRRRAIPGRKSGRRKVVADSEDSDEILLRRPSRRPELNAWREKTPIGRRWNRVDLVGYFVCRFRELRGEEPKEFFATLSKISAHHGSNVSKYTRRWLDGDYRRAAELVDKILERADGLGIPVKLGVFFTPATEGTSLRLDETRSRGRSETPAERNDRRGADTPANQEYFRKMQAESLARIRAEEARRNGTEDA